MLPKRPLASREPDGESAIELQGECELLVERKAWPEHRLGVDEGDELGGGLAFAIAAVRLGWRARTRGNLGGRPAAAAGAPRGPNVCSDVSAAACRRPRAAPHRGAAVLRPPAGGDRLPPRP